MDGQACNFSQLHHNPYRLSLIRGPRHQSPGSEVQAQFAALINGWGCEISGAVTHGGRSRGGLLEVHPNPSQRLGPAEMLHREQHRHPIHLHKGLGCVARFQSDLLDLSASMVPAGSCLPHKHGVTAGMSTLRLAGVYRAEAGAQLSLIISIFAIRIRLG